MSDRAQKRYDFNSTGGEGLEQEEAPDGEWVRFDDVAPLVAALREAIKTIEHFGYTVRAESQSELAFRKALEARAALANLDGGGA